MSEAPKNPAPRELTIDELRHMLKAQGRTPEVFRILRALWLMDQREAIQLMVDAWGDGEYIDEKQQEWLIHAVRRIKLMTLWYRAAAEHLEPKPDSVPGLALAAKRWRELDEEHPDWRETYRKLDSSEPDILETFSDLTLGTPNWMDLLRESFRDPKKILPKPLMRLKRLVESGEDVELKMRLKAAATFEERQRKGNKEQDHAFFRQYSKALQIPDEEIGKVSLDIHGLIILAWHALAGVEYTGNEPTKHQIKRWVEQYQKKKGELFLYDPKTWKRAWEDPFIAALFRD